MGTEGSNRVRRRHRCNARRASQPGGEAISSGEGEVIPVPKFLIDRNFSKITEDELGEFAKNSKRMAIERFHDVVWHHSHVVVDPDGVVHTFCIYSAPDESRLRAHAAAFGGHQIDSIAIIAGDVDPDEIVV
jgi:hypothetical protein